MPAAPAAPAIEVSVCGDQVCLTQAGAVELARYIEGLAAVNEALAGCNLVRRS